MPLDKVFRFAGAEIRNLTEIARHPGGLHAGLKLSRGRVRQFAMTLTPVRCRRRDGTVRCSLGCVIVCPQAVKIEAVSKVSTLRKLGVVARVAGQQAGRSRTLSAVMSGVRTTARSFGRAAHQLWLEVTGTVFPGHGRHSAAPPGSANTRSTLPDRRLPGRVAIAVCFTLTFAWFGLSSFWRGAKERVSVREFLDPR